MFQRTRRIVALNVRLADLVIQTCNIFTCSWPFYERRFLEICFMGILGITCCVHDTGVHNPKVPTLVTKTQRLSWRILHRRVVCLCTIVLHDSDTCCTFFFSALSVLEEHFEPSLWALEHSNPPIPQMTRQRPCSVSCLTQEVGMLFLFHPQAPSKGKGHEDHSA